MGKLPNQLQKGKTLKRDYIRPGIFPGVKKELLGKREILINPDLEEIQKTLVQVQKSTRKNKLSTNDVQLVWNQFFEEGVQNPHAGQIRTPNNYGFDMEASFIQLVEITPDLTGVLISREMTPPGMNTILPISKHLENNPRIWVNEVITTFWTHLTDEEIELVYERGTVQAMAIEPEEANKYSIYSPKRRDLQMQLLCRGNRPEFISELRKSLQDIAAKMTIENLENIAWHDFKKKWPSLSHRYQRDFHGLIRQGRLVKKDLLQFAAESLNDRYQLNLDFWRGPQRTFNTCQIVFRFGACSIWEVLAKKSRIHQEIVTKLQASSEISNHPTTRYTVGWIRVHVDDKNRICFMDEVQSDVMESLFIEKSENTKYAQVSAESLKEIEDWMVHGFATVQRWAYSIGYRIAIHSKDSAYNCETRDMTPSDRKWNTYYGSLIKHHKLELETFQNYPGPIFVEKKRES